jgi:hypothetical protein
MLTSRSLDSAQPLRGSDARLPRSVASVVRFPDGRLDIYERARFVGSVTTLRPGSFLAKDRWGEQLGKFDLKDCAIAAVAAAAKK